MHSSIFAISTDKNYDIDNLPDVDTEIYEEMCHIANYVDFDCDYISDVEAVTENTKEIVSYIPNATSDGNRIHIENTKEVVKALLKETVGIATELLDDSDSKNRSLETVLRKAMGLLCDDDCYIINLDDHNYTSSLNKFLRNLVAKDESLDLYVIACYDYHYS